MSMPNPNIEDVTAVVLEYHRPGATLQCIKSLSNAGITHILVWDNSTDNGATRSVLNAELTKEENLVRCVSIVGNNTNLGFSAGINAAISHLTGWRKSRYFLLINNDATINALGVSALLETMTSDASNAIVAPKYLNTDKQSSALMYYHPFLAAQTKKKYAGSFAFLSGCCLLVDIEKNGMPLFDEGFFMYGEDVALSRKLQDNHFKLAITESASVEHVGAASSVVGSAFYEYHVVRGHLLLTSRISRSAMHSVVLWPTRLASLATRSLIRSIRSRSMTPVTALWRAMFALGPA